MQKIINTLFLNFALLFALLYSSRATENEKLISLVNSGNYFILAEGKQVTPIYLDTMDFTGVLKIAEIFGNDIHRVTGKVPEFISDTLYIPENIIIIGTLGKNAAINELVNNKKIDITNIKYKWETFLIQVIENPFPTVKRALVIMGSDKRGTIYGMFELSAQIGVSPWYWWADVPVQKKENIYVIPGNYYLGQPAVKYRGIFINDEKPALDGWASEKFGGFNHYFYEKIFELMLRLKANYLWPAMWGSAFYDDDPLNSELADEYGIVIGTSHHEPMMRAHDEWKRYGEGEWNYEINEKNLKEFWKEGIQRMGDYESMVTIGMRGDGDMPMSEESNIALLEKIVNDQRGILAEKTGKDPSEIPQVWALYKEVMDYYEKGMKVPDDVTLLWCDDNWGNIRKLPDLSDTLRPGGYGIYYHFDYVGGPRNYKWINTNQISRIWEQMNLAWQYGVKQIWIVNVGDIKPMELPVQFFLDYAWNPGKWPAETLPKYVEDWSTRQFGREYAAEISTILTEYTKFNSRRKPELLSPDTYSIINYNEAETIITEFNELANKAENIYHAIPDEYKDAYYQLVLFPVKACANLNELYVTIAKNRLYAKQGRSSANRFAEKAKELFAFDAEFTHYYHNRISGGKWNHMMDQTHIGYTNWQQPDENRMPEVMKIDLPDKAEMGISIEGSEDCWPGSSTEAILPEFDIFNKQVSYIDVFNKGTASFFRYTVKTDVPWLLVKPYRGIVEEENRLLISVDWKKVPVGIHYPHVIVASQDGHAVTIKTVVKKPGMPVQEEMNGFIESRGYVSIEAEHYTRKLEKPPIYWQIIPDLGRTLSAIATFPVTAQAQEPGGESPRLEYNLYLFTTGDIKVNAYLSPTLNFHNTSGLRYAVSFDDEVPQIINIHDNDSLNAWSRMVSNNLNIQVSNHFIEKPGNHVLKYWMVDPGVVLQKIVVETREVKPCYLGLPESYYKSN